MVGVKMDFLINIPYCIESNKRIPELNIRKHNKLFFLFKEH